MNRIAPVTGAVILALLITACSEESDEGYTSSADTANAVTSVQPQQEEISSKQSEPLLEPVSVPNAIEENGVVYMEEIYANWPEQEVPVTEPVAEEDSEETSVDDDKSTTAEPQTHIINAQARIFKPDIIYINPGDTVGWVNMTSHNTVSVEGLIPEGATPWQSKLGENLKIQLDVEGVYGYVCQPHIGFGMMGLIVVGQPKNLESVQSFAADNLKGPFRRLIGKLNKVVVPE